MHLTLVPWIASAGELKTKPTQHSAKELLGLGIQPDILLCRCDREIPEGARKKIALFCNLRESCVIPALDVDTIYAVPAAYHAEGFDREVCRHFGLDAPEPDLEPLGRDRRRMCASPKARSRSRSSASTRICPTATNRWPRRWPMAASPTTSGSISTGSTARCSRPRSEAVRQLEGVHGILVPGGFGERGSEGKIEAARFAREREVPYFGICFGMQMAVIEAARHLADLPGAGSSEFGPCEHPVIGLMTEWMRGNELEQRERRRRSRRHDAARRLSRRCSTRKAGSPRSTATPRSASGTATATRSTSPIATRSRRPGLHFSGMSPDGLLPEIVEIPEHPWFIGVQFHPELKSKPFDPHPLFTSFVKAALDQSRLV